MDESSEQRVPAEKSKDAAEPVLTGEDITGLYAGEIELVVVVPVDLKIVSELYACLQTIPELKILHTKGSLIRGSTITVAIAKPVPLVQIISSKLTGIEIIPESIPKDSVEKVNPNLWWDTKKRTLHRLKLISKQA